MLIGSFLISNQSDLSLAKVTSIDLDSDVISQSQVESTDLNSLQKKVNKDSSNLKLRLKLARAYSLKKQPKKVVSTLRPVVDELGVGGLRLLAKAYRDQKDHLQVIRVLQFLLSKKDSDYLSWTRLGQTYSKVEKYTEAINAFQKAIRVNKKFRPAYDGLLIALEKAEQRYDLRETLVDMILQFGQKPALLNRLCEIYYQDGFLEGAQDICQRAISHSPKLADNHVFLGLTYKAANNTPRAIAIIQRAAQQFAKSELAQYHAALLNEENKNTFAAYKYYRRGARADREAFRSWLGFARTAFEIKNYEQAFVAFRHACKLNSQSTVQAFRSAASKLSRSPASSQWKKQFSNESLKCRFQ